MRLLNAKQITKRSENAALRRNSEHKESTHFRTAGQTAQASILAKLGPQASDPRSQQSDKQCNSWQYAEKQAISLKELTSFLFGEVGVLGSRSAAAGALSALLSAADDDAPRCSFSALDEDRVRLIGVLPLPMPSADADDALSARERVCDAI